MTTPYRLYAAPRRTGRVHLSRDGQFTLCNRRIRPPWKPVDGWHGYICLACRQVAEAEAKEPTP
jgi:hypothetical protein